MNRRMKSLCLRLVTPVVLCTGLSFTAQEGHAQTPPATASDSPQRQPIVRGIHLSTHGNGRDWGSTVMGPTCEDVATVGANWIATHPYASIREDGTVAWRKFDPADPPQELVNPIRAAHRHGLRILIKPHLAYWGTKFSWRGEIDFGSDEAAWDRFFTTYTAWIEAVAEACAEANGFCIGTELDKTIHYESEWRHITARVRAKTKAPLTYAANWTDFERVKFWDVLDVVGVQGYFPLAEVASAPTDKLRTSWRALAARLAKYGDRVNRDVLFTELGYNRTTLAAIEPWGYRTEGESAEPFQAQCMEIALAAIETEPRLVGSFLWKWFPGPSPVGRNFQLATPRMREAIGTVWLPKQGG